MLPYPSETPRLDQTRSRWKAARERTSPGQTESNEHKKYRICIVYMVMRLRRHSSVRGSSWDEEKKAPKHRTERAKRRSRRESTHKTSRLNEIHIWFLRYLYVVIKLSKLWSENFHCYRFSLLLLGVCLRFRLRRVAVYVVWLWARAEGRRRRILGENKSVYKMKMTSFYFLIFSLSALALVHFFFYGYCLLLCVLRGVFRKIVIVEAVCCGNLQRVAFRCAWVEKFYMRKFECFCRESSALL